MTGTHDRDAADLRRAVEESRRLRQERRKVQGEAAAAIARAKAIMRWADLNYVKSGHAAGCAATNTRCLLSLVTLGL